MARTQALLALLAFALLVGQTTGGTTWSGSIIYDFYCTNSEFGRKVGLVPRDGFLIDLDPSDSVHITAKVRNTPNQNHHGHGDFDGDTDVDALLVGDLDLHDHPFALFPKGAGKPEDWFAATGNPYIYFSSYYSGPAWQCEFVDSETKDPVTDVPYCESDAYTHHEQQANKPCIFGENHYFTKKPYSSSPDPDSDGPPRSRHIGDLFVGRCVRWDEALVPLDYSVKCWSDSIPDNDIVMYPSCQSHSHNIGLGIGIDLINHHRVIASQISPLKFSGCGSTKTGPTSGCEQGAGPHEAYDDDTCLEPPALGVLIDKSAGSTQTGGDSSGYKCYTGGDNPADKDEWGNAVITKPKPETSDVFSSFRRNATQARHQEDFTACGVGGNPCIYEFTCQYNDDETTPCFGGEEDVLDLLDCRGDDPNQCGTGEQAGCRCATIRREVRETYVVSCYSEEGEEGHHHGEDGEDGDGEDGE